MNSSKGLVPSEDEHVQLGRHRGGHPCETEIRVLWLCPGAVELGKPHPLDSVNHTVLPAREFTLQTMRQEVPII